METGYYDITWKYAGDLDHEANTDRVYLGADTTPVEWAENNSGPALDTTRVVVRAARVPVDVPCSACSGELAIRETASCEFCGGSGLVSGVA